MILENNQIQRLIDHFKLTNDYKKAGYILPSGEMLDFKRDLPKIKGNGGLDHETINQLFPEIEIRNSRDKMYKLIYDLQLVRISYDDGMLSINYGNSITQKQSNKIFDIIKNAYVDRIDIEVSDITGDTLEDFTVTDTENKKEMNQLNQFIWKSL